MVKEETGRTGSVSISFPSLKRGFLAVEVILGALVEVSANFPTVACHSLSELLSSKSCFVVTLLPALELGFLLYFGDMGITFLKKIKCV